MFYYYTMRYLLRRSRFVSGPSRGKVDAMHKGLNVSIYAKPELFPAPTEVDRVSYNVSYVRFSKPTLKVSVPLRGR